MSVVLLSGGTGGAKLARGLYDLLGERLTVIANTGDDIEIHGGHVSPDPDLIAYSLAGCIDDRGWGIADDTFAVMDGLRALGVEVWFNLGDRDLAVCLERRRLLAAGLHPSEALDRLCAALGVTARLLPMTEQPVRTEIQTGGSWIGLQEFLIRLGGAAPIADVRFSGAEQATVCPAAADAIEAASVILIGPSNPIISIGPILAVPGMRTRLAQAGAPVIAVSPIVGGQVLKGPTAAFMTAAGHPVDAAGIAACYQGLLDGIVADEPAPGLPSLQTDTLMSDAPSRRRLAADTLAFAADLRCGD